jgi:hypothetical protein
MAYYGKREYESAASDFANAIELDPRFLTIYEGHGMLVEMDGAS